MHKNVPRKETLQYVYILYKIKHAYVKVLAYNELFLFTVYYKTFFSHNDLLFIPEYFILLHVFNFFFSTYTPEAYCNATLNLTIQCWESFSLNREESYRIFLVSYLKKLYKGIQFLYIKNIVYLYTHTHT